MASSHCTLLLIVIVLSSCYVSGETISINTSWEFEQYLCNKTYHVNEKILLELDSSVIYNITINSFCFMSKVDITIRSSSTNSPAVISCVQDDHIPVPTLGLAFINSSISLQGVTFVNCGRYINTLRDDINMFNSSSLYYNSTHAAALLFINCTLNMSEVELRSSYGFAVIGINLLNSVIHYVNMSHSTASAFMYNYYNETIGCGMMLHFLQAEESKFHKVSIEQSTFSYNYDLQNDSSCANNMDLQSGSEMVVSAAALTILYTQHDYQANVFINNSKFNGNSGTIGGAVLILHYNSYYRGHVYITNTHFKSNNLLGYHQCYGADVSFNFLSSLEMQPPNDTVVVPLIIEQTNFCDALFSSYERTYFKAGAIYICVKKNDAFNMNMLFKDIICSNRVATHRGVCIFAERIGLYKEGNVSVSLESVDAINNSLSSIIPYAGMFAFRRVNCYINGTKEKPSTLRNNLGVVIDAADSNIYLSGFILFDANKGISGAAIKMKYGSRLHFMNGLTANFTNNQAVLGGAIYADVNNIQEECAFYFTSDDIKIFFHNNIATEAGNDIYAFPIYNCQFDDSSNSYTPYQALSFYENSFYLFDHPGNTLWSISTKPTKLHLNNTITSSSIIYTYPGQMVSLKLSALDELNRFVYTNVKINIFHGKRDSSSHLWLSYEDKVQIIQESRYKNYTNIRFTVHATTVHNQSLNGILILSLFDYTESVYSDVHIHVHPCPLGFILDNIKTGDCVCSPVLYAFAKDNSIPMTCSIQNQTFTRSTSTVSWAGLIEIEEGINVFGISRSCPLGHCMANPAFDHFISTREAELFVAYQINEKVYETPVCINDREGTLCGKCKDGLSVVFGSQKCIRCSNNWIWTALVQVALSAIVVYFLFVLRLTLTTGTLNGIIFYAQAANGGLFDLLSLYSDFDIISTAAKKLVQTVYVFLSILNLNLGLHVCFYDGMTELWKTGLSLAFPIYLLIIVVILIILSRYSTWLSNKISHSSVQVLVTVVHLSFSRLLLTIINVFTSSIVYTSVKHYRVWYRDGTVEYMGQSHRILVIISLILTVPLVLPYIAFFFLAKPLIRHSPKANHYLRPVFEAIHAPFKEGKHHWFVARLLLLIIIYILYTVYKTVHGSVLYISVAALLASFLIGQALFQPYKNKLINLLDCWLMFNLTLVYVTLSYVNLREATIFSVVAVLLVFLTFLAILLYHILWVSRLLIKIRRGVVTCRKWISDHVAFYKRNQTQHNQPLQGAVDSFYGSCREYREPILSASH